MLPAPAEAERRGTAKAHAAGCNPRLLGLFPCRGTGEELPDKMKRERVCSTRGGGQALRPNLFVSLKGKPVNRGGPRSATLDPPCFDAVRWVVIMVLAPRFALGDWFRLVFDPPRSQNTV